VVTAQDAVATEWRSRSLSASKLSDAQLVLLSSAAQHPQGAIKLDLKGAAAKISNLWPS
jgi:hypothetical protein